MTKEGLFSTLFEGMPATDYQRALLIHYALPALESALCLLGSSEGTTSTEPGILSNM
jgi:hypothetical protein